MDRPNSNSSTPVPLIRTGSSSGPFAYQTRLLESKSSRGGSILSRTNSLQRTNSQSGGDLSPVTPNPTGGGSRKWTPSHRVGASLDAVRGKWEERAQAEAALEGRAPSSLSREASEEGPAAPLTHRFQDTPSPSKTAPGDRASFVTPTKSAEFPKTPTYLKRHTMPSPIMASPLSPNTTGMTVESPDSPSAAYASSSRIHLPSSTHSHSLAAVPTMQHMTTYSPSSSTDHPSTANLSPPRTRRSNTLEDITAKLTSKSAEPSSSTSTSNFSSQASILTTTSSKSSLDRRPSSVSEKRQLFTSLSDSFDAKPALRSAPAWQTSHSPTRKQDTLPMIPSPERRSYSPVRKVDPLPALRKQDPLPPLPSPGASSPMAPTPYRSSYSKKASTYGDNMIVGRKLGRHLPRIASGDVEDEVKEDLPLSPERLTRRERVERRYRQIDGFEPVSPDKSKPDIVVPGVTDAGDVAGLRGRMKLSREKAVRAPASPLPSARLTRGLWADTQRHLIQAYEYLCHVGEAQQWIEGCLGEELGFGVVEMEEGLRNGVVLAKLVRAFKGEAAVRKIYEAPKLDFRHSQNINYFFDFVREAGLPEGFIFELTDLYEKKNLPKVIYCIHALSHLLARRGLAERIGNLLGHLKFSDDQLQQTQKGLKDAGVPMPNFGNVGKQLATEINEEPEVEIETDDERRDRLLLENEDSIIAFQTAARGALARRARATQRGEFSLVSRLVRKVQAQSRGALARRCLQGRRQEQANLTPWVIALQATIRGMVARWRWRLKLRMIRASVKTVIKVQAQARGVMQRRRFAYLKAALRTSSVSVLKLQSAARARIVRKGHKELGKVFVRQGVAKSVVSLQARARGYLERQQASRQAQALHNSERRYVALQAQARGLIMRRRMRAQLAKLEDVTATVVRIQAAVRTYLARKRLLTLIRGLRKATPMLIGLQARARANISRQRHQNVNKALAEVKVVSGVHSFQARARAALTRNKHKEQTKQLEFAEPDVVGVQAVARGALVRRDYHAWREHLRRNQPVATILQAMLRGVMQRRAFREKMHYYRTNLDKVVKIQSLYRAKEQREQYRQLTLGKNVSVGTIKNFVHLLDDSESDFQEEIKVERLRKRVVEGIRENQALEHDVSDLDVKIALVVQNAKSFEELLKVRRRHGADSAAVHAARASVLAAHGDPFAGPATLDHDAKRKLELYQQLFYLLQTRPEYWSRLFHGMSAEKTPEKNRRLVERVVLTLFGFGQDRREHFLLLKLFQLSIQEEVARAASIGEVIHGHPMYINIAVQYVRPKQITYVREALQNVIVDVINYEDLDLEVDPTKIHRARLEQQEMRSGIPCAQVKDVPFREAIKDPNTRPMYIRHLQILQWWTEAFVSAIIQSTRKLPYGVRYMARETLAAVREKFPDAPDELCAACIGRLVYYRYINPAIITPETFDIVANTVDISARKNLAQISKVLTQITSVSEFGEEDASYVPINEFVRKAITQITAWLLDVANVPDAENQFHAHEFLDVTVQPKPIYISPNEVYAMHSLLAQNQRSLAPERDDTLNAILSDLDGVPNLGTDELSDARDKAVTLDLTNRFANVRDPHADEKALWVQAKRGVLAILRVQPGEDLVESLMRPVTDNDEMLWDDIVTAELEHEHRSHPGRIPSQTAADSAYRLEDIRELTFKKVKAHAIFFLLELEKQGKITRNDGFQGILNAIAGDVRSKHRKRLQRQQEMDAMNDALRHLAERKRYFQEQIDSYHDYVEAAMATMQRGKGKKRFLIPFTKQWAHTRDNLRAGIAPEYGSFRYTAKYLYDKEILISIDGFSPRQFDKIDLVISSSKAGVFMLELYNNTLNITNRMGSQEVRMEDLLQARFENKMSLALFNNLVKVNLERFLFQINKKFHG